MNAPPAPACCFQSSFTPTGVHALPRSALERELRPQPDSVEAVADLLRAGGVQPVHVDYVPIQHEAQGVRRVPGQAEPYRFLPAAIDPAGRRLRPAAADLVVEVDQAPARHHLPGAPAAAAQRAGLCRIGPAEGGRAVPLAPRRAGDDPARLDIAAVEGQ